MEAFLHYIWQNKLYEDLLPQRSLVGAEVEVIDTGLLNTNSGPDFFNAKIRINDIVWVGCVEIHQSAHQWFQHKHNEDPAYNNVILHVVEQDNKLILRNNSTEEELFCCEMVLNKAERGTMQSNFVKDKLDSYNFDVLKALPESYLPEFLELMKWERFERKKELVRKLWRANAQDWAKTLYLLFIRYFGFGINNDNMEYLGRCTDLKLLLRHQGLEREAILLGQAGVIERVEDKDYANQLAKTYEYIKHKYQLKPLDKSLFKQFRLRPSAFSHKGLKELLTLLERLNFGADCFEACVSVDDFRNLLRYGSVDKASIKAMKIKAGLSKQTADMLLINVVAPYLAVAEEQLCRKPRFAEPLHLWRQLPVEDNKVIRQFRAEGFELKDASDSQAVLHLRKEYYDKHICLLTPLNKFILTKEKTKK